MCKGFNSSIFNFILAVPFDARTEERGLLFFFTQSLEVIIVPAGTDSDLQAFSQNPAKETLHHCCSDNCECQPLESQTSCALEAFHGQPSLCSSINLTVTSIVGT